MELDEYTQPCVNSFYKSNYVNCGTNPQQSPTGASLSTLKSNLAGSAGYLSPFRPATASSPPNTRQPQLPSPNTSPLVGARTGSSTGSSQSPSPQTQARQFANSNFIHSTYTKQGLTRTSPQGSDQGSVSSSDSEGKNAPRVSLSINRRIKMQNLESAMLNDPPPPDLIPQNEKSLMIFSSAKGNNLSTNTTRSSDPTELNSSGNAQMSSSRVGEDQVDAFYQHVESDKLHIRSDNLRAAKRRSWAQDMSSTSSHDEAEHIRRVLRREQMRGRFHINMSQIFGQAQRESTAPPPEKITQPSPPVLEEKKEEAEDISPPMVPSSSPPETQQASPESPQKEVTRDSPELEIRPPPPYEWHIQQNRQQQFDQRQGEAMSSDSSDNGENQRITVINVDPEIQLPPPPAKGILRIGPKEKPKRNIIFDPLALLLDAALEGELDLVKKSAQRLDNVSTSNDEGITALHNAICAGHYEIVRFLVEANADVNSQDSDGWTPLHCAASCNNLPMVKFLVERGACVFATTVSDHETPADKCEEDEDGFDGCSQFLISIQDKIGHMNDGRVYAAFHYDEAEEREDELTFVEGDEMVILNRGPDCPEKGWWWARHESSKKEGYVPRNYLALYPRLAAQKAMQALKGIQDTDKEGNKDSMEIEEKRSSVTSTGSDKGNKTTPMETNNSINSASDSPSMEIEE